MADEDLPAADVFEQIYAAINRSAVYHDIVAASEIGLPDWLVPFSTVTLDLLERLRSALDLSAGETFLDLACGAGGPGLWLAERTGASVIGVDFAASAVTAATALAAYRGMSARARYLHGNATATGLPDECVRGVMSIDALMFVDAQAVAAEIARVLAPGGVLAMTAAESLGEPFTPTIVRDYRPIFEAVGFTPIEHVERSGYAEREAVFYGAVGARAAALRAEIGPAADYLIEEAQEFLQRDRSQTARVRHMLFVARRRP